MRMCFSLLTLKAFAMLLLNFFVTNAQFTGYLQVS